MKVLLIIDVLIIIIGFYLVIGTKKMGDSGEINSMLLAEEEIKKVKDSKGFIKFISPICYLFGGVSFLLGVVGIVAGFVNIPYWSYVELAIFLIVLLIFSFKLQKARSLYV